MLTHNFCQVHAPKATPLSVGARRGAATIIALDWAGRGAPALGARSGDVVAVRVGGLSAPGGGAGGTSSSSTTILFGRPPIALRGVMAPPAI